ncbi:MAG: DNA cytosine methyltransferase [Clostridiales bacterium]|nr:DNA cytosine methyltransferase [Clostridiales bacterium]
MYKVVSVFSGCGGADLGIVGGFQFNNQMYEALPYDIVYATDINEKALNTYKENFNCHQVICDDIKNINSEDIPCHDVLVGGFPCQSFSTVNPTKDPFDDRANLYKEMVRLLRDKNPKAFIAENVRGFMTLHKGKIFDRVINEFELSGYKTHSVLLNSADYGVPQKRQRVIIVGIRKDINKEYLFPEKTTPNEGNKNEWVPLSVAIESLIPKDEKYYFSKRAVEGMKRAKNNMKRGLYQNLDEPCLTIASHLAKVSLNSRDPVLLVNPEKELYRRFTPREAARIQSFPDDFIFVGSKGDAYRQIGNAVPPVLSWHIAKTLIDVLNSSNEIEVYQKEELRKTVNF